MWANNTNQQTNPTRLLLDCPGVEYESTLQLISKEEAQEQEEDEEDEEEEDDDDEKEEEEDDEEG
jgi:hypothetical protein